MISNKKNIQKIFMSITLIFCCQCVFAQTKITVEEIKQINAQLFCLTTPTDTIEFTKSDTINRKKPLFLFIQGSLPKPIIEDNGDNDYYLVGFNFYVNILKGFNVIEIAMPSTPAIAKHKDLDNQGSYVKSEKPYDYDKTYMKRNVIETYVERANVVIDYLLQQDWIDNDSVFVFGHSQGAFVAARLASENENVTAVGFSSANPFGRYAGMMQETRAKAITGQITEEQAQKQINNYWSYWNYYCYATDIPNDYIGDLPATWKSFSQSVAEILANLKQPLFVVYGTKDYHSVACELLPIYFGFSEKTNYKLHPMLGRGHNFESFDENGNPNWNDMKWQDVTIEFIKFVRNK
ncbi:MAG: alpha/beta hydrolase [Prevotellaceae bacterium]|nr:alpha/beta hydrolase [Prevotellaceae bacterium]